MSLLRPAAGPSGNAAVCPRGWLPDRRGWAGADRA